MYKIQCPSCDSQFDSEQDLIGDFVECGSCGKQFTVMESHINSGNSPISLNKQKDLTSFTKTFDAVKVDPKQQAKIDQHQKHLDKLRPDDFMPVPMWKQAVIWLGWTLLLSGAALLVLGTLNNGFLSDIGLMKRFIIAGSIAFLSIFCFIIGAKRISGAFPKSLLAILLMSALAYFLPSAPIVNRAPDSDVQVQSSPTVDTPLAGVAEGASISKIKEICRYNPPVQEAIDTAIAGGDPKAESVVAVWIKNAPEEQQFNIQDFYKNTLGLIARPGIYLRQYGSLVVLEGLKDYTLAEIADKSYKIGDIKDVYVSERLISLEYATERLKEMENTSRATLTDPNNDYFYAQNFKELEHFDSRRILSALTRLENVPPRFEGDAMNRFTGVLKGFKDKKIQSAASSCILKWFGEKEQKLKERVQEFDEIADYDAKGNDTDLWSEELVMLLLRAGSTKAPATALALWNKNPTEWENVLINSRRDFTGLVYKEVSSDRKKNQSIINVLARTRSPNSKNLLTSLKSQLDNSYAAALEQALSKFE